MHNSSELKRPLRILPAVTGSTFGQGLLCFAVLFLVLSLVPGELLPEGDRPAPGTRELLSKIPSFLSSPTNPDVVLMGSSLFIAPALCCDKSVPGVKLPPPSAARGYQYDKAHFLERRLQRMTGQNVHVFNLAIPGSMMSDQCLLLEEMLDSGKQPAVIVLGLAPRDFVANDQPVPEATPIAQEVENLRKTRVDGWKGQPARLWESVCANVESLKQKLAAAKSAIDKRVLALRDSLSDSISEARPAVGTRLDVAASRGGAEDAGAKTREQMDFYRRIYAVHDWKNVERQYGYLDRALGKARGKGISLVLISMPLSSDNLKLIEARALNGYLTRVSSVAEKYSVPYLNLLSSTQGQYSTEEFTDSVHLGAQGGRRFFTQLAEWLTEERRLFARLKRHDEH